MPGFTASPSLTYKMPVSMRLNQSICPYSFKICYNSIDSELKTFNMPSMDTGSLSSHEIIASEDSPYPLK